MLLHQLPPLLAHALMRIQPQSLGGEVPLGSVSDVGDGWWRVEFAVELTDSIVEQDFWQITLEPAFTPTFHWAPHLSPHDDDVIEQQIFRAPVLIAADAEQVLWLIPDVEAVGVGPVRTWLDQDARLNHWQVGRSCTEQHGHVMYRRAPGARFHGRERISFLLAASDTAADIANPFRKPCAYFWQRFGSPAFGAGQPISGDLTPFVQHTYAWAFERWKDVVWQEFELDGKRVGAPAFIVTAAQSPNHTGPAEQRELLSIWNQAWFSSLRSAAGLMRWARRSGDAALAEKAVLTKELALAFPQDERGLFHGLIGCENEEVVIDGKRVRRSRGWSTRYFANSDRQPIAGRSPRTAPFHLTDMAWTGLQMVRWYHELERDERLLAYAQRFAAGLLTFQDAEGWFPSWVEQRTWDVVPVLAQSPQTSVMAQFLLELHRIDHDPRWRAAALRALSVVVREVIPVGRWEDFETYWSCCRWGCDGMVGKRVERNARYKQNTLSIYWTAEALTVAADITGDQTWLTPARRCLDELLLYQAAWQPPYLYVPVVGGFGVMNLDSEWNDARQSLFAEFIAASAARFSCDEYLERGVAALRASFSMMFCPENPRTHAQWLIAYPYFNALDHGFMMENYGHGNITAPNGIGIGPFTIYDWGNGAAAEAWNRMADHGFIAHSPTHAAQPPMAFGVM